MKRSGYSETWDDFLRKLKQQQSPNQRKAFLEEATIDPAIAMIIALSHELRRPRQLRDQANRIRWAQMRLVAAQERAAEERRLAINETARCHYLDEGTRGMLPPIRVLVQPHADVLRDRRGARSFWRSIDRGNVRGTTVSRIVERESVSGRAMAVAHPYGPPVEAERLAAFANDLLRWRAGGVTPTLDERVRLYNPRAAKQIAHMLTSLRRRR